jgi:hypothetical protein
VIPTESRGVPYFSGGKRGGNGATAIAAVLSSLFAGFGVLSASIGYASLSDPRVAWQMGGAFSAAVLGLWVALPLAWLYVNRSLFDPFGFLLGAGLAFWSGEVILSTLGLDDGALLNGRFPQSTLAATLGLVVAALLSLSAGAFAGKAYLEARWGRHNRRSTDAKDMRALALAGCVLLAIGVPATVALLKWAFAGVADFAYMALYAPERTRVMPHWARLLSPYLVPGAMFWIATGRRWLAGPALAILAANALCLLLVGQRALAVLPVLGGVWLWSRCIGPVRRMALAAAALAMLGIVFPLVRENRMVHGEGGRAETMLRTPRAVWTGGWVSSLAEMGGSMATIAYVVELVPSRRPWDLGGTYGMASTSALPNLGEGTHPSAGVAQPSRWLVWEVSPEWATAGGGLGFSSVAEGYLNFGWAGVVVTQWVLGFGLVLAWLLAERKESRVGLALLASCLAAVIFFVRADSLTLMRPLLWYAGGGFAVYLAARKVSVGSSGSPANVGS